MRRSICTCDPHFVIAGNKSTYRFIFTTANDLKKNTKLIFDLNSQGRYFDWQIPQANLKSKSNLIWAEIPNSKPISAKQISLDKFEFTLPKDLKISESITFFIGSLDDKSSGNFCQLYTQRKKSFNLHISYDGKKENDTFYLDVKGNKLFNIKAITPSYVLRNKRFDVTIRFEDEFGNLTSNTDEDTLIELSYQHLRENLSWKLFIPETGFIMLPSLYFNEPGIYKIKLKNLKNNQEYFSDPILCFEFDDTNLYWGQLHSESIRYDTQKEIDISLRSFRDTSSHDYSATSSFDSEKETSTDAWKKIAATVSEFNEDERFISFLGEQWLGDLKEEGLRQFIFSKDNKSILRKDDLKSNSLKKIYKTFTPKDLISIPSFTMGSQSLYDFKDYNPYYERVVEIYNAWGSSEGLEKNGNLHPIEGPKKEQKGNIEGSVINALINGCRFGFVAGGYDDRGIYKDFYDNEQKQYRAGLTGILAKIHTRDSLFQAMYNRSTIATTGEKILVGLNVANMPIGSELNTIQKPGLMFNRFISGYVIGTDLIKEVQIYRNGKLLNKFNPKKDTFEFEFDDSNNLLDVAIKKEGHPPFVFYYLKAIQNNNHVAWTSPIWVDHITDASSIKKTKKK
ncbi:MAG: hypothetical protein K1060chlam5_00348 [Candidatus Anoxychlamydiales bacterium]|nr:hypothetical protein [Candidatus Anoxychlamydiales bacterium]